MGLLDVGLVGLEATKKRKAERGNYEEVTKRLGGVQHRGEKKK